MDLLVYENKIYILTKQALRVYTFKFEKIFEAPVENGKRFRRENEFILVITNNSILKYVPEKEMIKIFQDPKARIVDKNTLSYFEIKANKLYLYSLENNNEPRQQEEPDLQQKAPEQVVKQPEEKVSEAGSQEEKLEKKTQEIEEKNPAESSLQKLIEEISTLESVGD